MTKRPHINKLLAQQVAEDVADARDASTAEKPAPAEPEVAVEAPKAKRGRPRGKREVASKQTLYLDEARYEALVRIAADRGRSLHSLIIEGVDHVIGKPAAPGWKPRD